MQRRHPVLSLCACLVVLMTIAGCSGSPSDEESVPNPNEMILEQARASSSEDWQIHILEQGEVSFADYETAINMSLDCMRDAGIDVLGPELINDMGLERLNYSWSPDLPGLTQEQGTALGRDCIDRFSRWIAMAFHTQTAAQEAQEEYFKAFQPAVVACVNENGGQAKDDGTRSETIQAAMDLWDETGTDCLTIAGVDTSGGISW